ncbi:MAG: cupin domain-containing protein [Devosia sp.]
MHSLAKMTILMAGLGLPFAAVADEAPLTKPNLLLRESVTGMPTGADQEIRVLSAVFEPGSKTVYHTHRSPVTVYVLEGAFTLELANELPRSVEAGQAFVEPPNVAMTGYNRSATEKTRVLIFYVSDPSTPFLDLIN